MTSKIGVGALGIALMLGGCTVHTTSKEQTGGDGGPAGTSQAPAPSGDAGTTTPNACESNGGRLLADGFCFKNCTYDEKSPGGDLFGDCSSLKMICIYDYTTLKSSPSYCKPAWGSECSSDAECGAGAKCVTSTGATGTRSSCKIACDTSTDCGTLRCVTKCTSGYFTDVRFCADNYGWPPDFDEPSNCTEQ